MEFIEWSNELEIGITKVDDQHQCLVSLINRVHELVAHGHERKKLGEIFSELIDYTIEHFQDEEFIMAEIGYPDLEKHKKQHNGLTRQVLELQKSFRDGSATISYEVLDFLSQWLVSHIMNSDKKIVEYQKTLESNNPFPLPVVTSAKSDSLDSFLLEAQFGIDIEAIEKTLQENGGITFNQAQSLIDALKKKEKTPYLKPKFQCKYYQEQENTFTCALSKPISRMLPNEYIQLLEVESIADIAERSYKYANLTVLFADLRNFTSIAEDSTAEETFALLNDYYNILEPAIRKHSGFVDKYVGDAVVGVFTESSIAAIHAGIYIVRAMNKFNEIRRTKQKEGITAGIGIHRDRILVGSLGNNNRMEISVIGDGVNLASRIETLTKVYKVPLIVSGDSLTDGGMSGNSLFTREIDNVRVKGREKPITLFEVLNTDSQEILEKKIQSMNLYDEALSLFKCGKFQDAIASFIECGKICPEDEIPERYIRRCSTLLRVPPGDDWTGVTTL